MIRGNSGSTIVLRIYMAVFFAYMFLPLGVMVAAEVNDYSPPSITVWQGFTLRWFAEFWGDARMWSGLVNSLLIAGTVMALALPIGLSGALLLSQLGKRSAGLLYTVMVSPLLTPGIIIGISTVILWRNFGTTAGLFTAILAQSAFIASYAMLMFMARMQFGISPMINAIGILFIVVTVVCAVAWALLRQRERLQEAAA
jgi:spermidine/putrescine transport system permease protein